MRDGLGFDSESAFRVLALSLDEHGCFNNVHRQVLPLLLPDRLLEVQLGVRDACTLAARSASDQEPPKAWHCYKKAKRQDACNG